MEPSACIDGLPSADLESSSDKPRYCYACRREHPAGHPMRRVATRSGPRWRCQASLDAARMSPAARDAWGREKTMANRLVARCVMEVFNQRRAMREPG